MPIPSFNGDTFVAFVDISGFKELMKVQGKANEAIYRFYSKGYEILRSHRNVHGLFVSDCAILFVPNQDDKKTKIKAILNVVEKLNRELLFNKIMLTTSICYGPFSYQQRLEFEGIEKNPIIGNAYLDAFHDNGAVKPRLQPGQCRIRKSDLNSQDISDLRIKATKSHYYFYWMVQNARKISSFEKSYSDAYQLKFRGMLDALNEAVNGTSGPPYV